MKFIISEQNTSPNKFIVCAEDDKNTGMCDPNSPAATELFGSQAQEVLRLVNWAYRRGYQKKAESVNAAIRSIMNEESY